jgi:phage repressor protein C with HTH and peptisase S24 domain
MAVVDFCVACGEFIDVGDLDRKELPHPGRTLVPFGIPYLEGIFAVRARGGSMEPRILDKAWCIFHPKVAGTRQDRTVLEEDQSKPGIRTLHLEEVSQPYRLSARWQLVT